MRYRAAASPEPPPSLQKEAFLLDYETCLDRIHALERYGSRLGLDRMRELLRRLGDPQKDLPVIHVAGTNGKGSVSRYLASVLLAHGCRVGLYTSPYLERFTERIEYMGEEIAHAELCEAAEAVLGAVEDMTRDGWDSPTEFEAVTAIGFWYYSRRPLDYLVLEVGLGGRFDATNVVEAPLLTLITSIDLDHMAQLGNSLGAIAGEKAGIFKPGCPAVYLVHSEEAREIIEARAEELGCPCYDAGRAARAELLEERLQGCRFRPEVLGRTLPEITLSMGGLHQVENALVALTGLVVLEERGLLRLREDALCLGMRQARQHGRLEILREEPLLLIDGAHNPAGVNSLVRAVAPHLAGKRLLLLSGVLADKDSDRMVQALRVLEGDVVCTEPASPRKLAADALAEKMREGRSGTVRAIADPMEACRYAEEHAADYDVILAAGSLYLIGLVRSYFKHEE